MADNKNRHDEPIVIEFGTGGEDGVVKPLRFTLDAPGRATGPLGRPDFRNSIEAGLLSPNGVEIAVQPGDGREGDEA